MAQSVIINGTTYTDVPRIDIPKSGSGGGTAKFYDTSDADGGANNVLSGKVVYGSSGQITGTMANRGDGSKDLTTVNDSKMLSSGYYSEGQIKIASAEQAKIISANIKSGVTILGVAGSLTSATISQDASTNVLSIS